MITLPLRQALELFEDNLSNIRVACLENAQEIIAINSPYLEPNEDDPMTVDNIMLHLNFMRIERDAKPLLETVKRIDSYRLHKDTPHSPGFITDDDIQAAKSIGEEWFIYEASLNHKKVGICPFHADRNASLTLVRSKQTGHLYLKCYPCGKSWNSISFTMEQNNLDFIEAVKYIVGK
jgi:hypothetical protein